MQRMPNPFETRTHALQSAAGGGTTCTTCCSCCVATLAASVLIPHAVFKGLVPRVDGLTGPADQPQREVQVPPQPVGDAVRADDGFAASPNAVATQDAAVTDSIAGDAVNELHVAPRTQSGEAVPASSAGGLTSGESWSYAWAVAGAAVAGLVIMGFLVAMFGATVGAVLGCIVSLAMVLGVFSKAYQRAGRAGGDGVRVGVGVVFILVIVLVAEVAVWVTMIFS